MLMNNYIVYQLYFNLFPHTTNLHQTTLKTSRQKYRNIINERRIINEYENIAAKGEIAHNEQFLLLTQCFKKLYPAEVSESFCMWERVK